MRPRSGASFSTRLAFEERATWLVETLEKEREAIARQTAYALALEQEAGLLRMH